MNPIRCTPRGLAARAVLLCLAVLGAVLVAGPALAQVAPPAPSPPPGFSLVSVLALVSTRAWLPLAVVGVLYLRTIFSDKSRFPWSISDQWLHVFVGALTAVLGALVALQNGIPVGTAIVGAIVAGGAAGLFDGLATAIFGDPSKAPGWARFLLMIADDLTGGGSATQLRKSAPTPVPSGSKPPAAARLGRLAGALAVGAFLGVLVFAPRPAPTAKVDVAESAMVGEGCAWWNSGGSAQVQSAGMKDGLCVVTQLLAGNGVNGALACAGATIDDVLATLGDLIKFYLAGLDGGAPPAATSSAYLSSGAVICGVGAPPNGASQCVTPPQFTLLQSAQAEAKLRKSGTGAKGAVQ